MAEIKLAIDNTPLDKSPGPDGLSFEFYKYWSNESAQILADVANSCWEAGIVPNS
ncbi:hypothetical protein GGI03_002399, partial [Coemansia sp. RSA 2337]